MSEWLFWPLRGYLEETLFPSWGSLHPWQLLSWWLLIQKALCQSQLLWEAYTRSGRIRFDLGKPQWTLDAYSCLGWLQSSYWNSHSGLEWGECFSDVLAQSLWLEEGHPCPFETGGWFTLVTFQCAYLTLVIHGTCLYSKSILCSSPGYINGPSHPFQLILNYSPEYWPVALLYKVQVKTSSHGLLTDLWSYK